MLKLLPAACNYSWDSSRDLFSVSTCKTNFCCPSLPCALALSTCPWSDFSSRSNCRMRSFCCSTYRSSCCARANLSSDTRRTSSISSLRCSSTCWVLESPSSLSCATNSSFRRTSSFRSSICFSYSAYRFSLLRFSSSSCARFASRSSLFC